MANKPNFNVVFIGHVDHGKSTAIGRMFFETGKFTEQELQKMKDIAEKLGKKGFEFAFVMDRFKEERERGLTIDLAYRKMVTNKYSVTVIDAPGHRDFVKNMITGTSQADAAILVVAVQHGVMAQTKEHVWLARTMGVGQVAVLVNQMDTVNYDESKYKKVVEDITTLLKTAGYKTDKMNFIPASAFVGDNITKKSDKMSWYKGPTLLEQFDLFDEPKKPTDMPLRMPVQDVYTITGVGTVPVGKIETGKMKVGEQVIVLPAKTGKGISGEVKTIEMHHETMPEAIAGDNVGINIRGVGKTDIARGDVIASVASPPPIAEEFTAQIAVINHPTVIAKGYTPVLHIHTAQVPAQFVELQKKLDPKTGQVAQENPDFVKNGDVVIAKLKPLKPLVIEKQSDNPNMARFAVRDAGQTVAAGICIDLTPKKL
ncbi:MAG: translation elongation factor EF-1 subunit alpha [Candidatus Pacearchaeota archaeon]|nr:MAG: translation elongation factor EF-1 subunit alpha [Candidatus Pacearchaeota archaeon]